MTALEKKTIQNSWKNSIVDGEYKRRDSVFRNWVQNVPDAEFPAERDRYHLYVSLACPWAHRTLIMRRLKGLEDVISVSVVHPDMHEFGWSFDSNYPGATGDDLNGFNYLREVYQLASTQYEGNITVPVLWDKKQQRIVNNESEEIIRMLNTEFNHITKNDSDYFPTPLRNDIEQINNMVYHNINNGVYKSGFATTQAAYEKNVLQLFKSLDDVESILSKQRYLIGNDITEADIRLFTTLVRFDAVYVGHFKCNLKRIEDYPNLSNYLRDLFQTKGFHEDVDISYIKRHYYASHISINGTGIVPLGPDQDFSRPHDRNKFNH